MRTEDQIKRKLNELNILLKTDSNMAIPQVASVAAQIQILEWVLNQPTESYHN